MSGPRAVTNINFEAQGATSKATTDLIQGIIQSVILAAPHHIEGTNKPTKAELPLVADINTKLDDAQKKLDIFKLLADKVKNSYDIDAVNEKTQSVGKLQTEVLNLMLEGKSFKEKFNPVRQAFKTCKQEVDALKSKSLYTPEVFAQIDIVNKNIKTLFGSLNLQLEKISTAGMKEQGNKLLKAMREYHNSVEKLYVAVVTHENKVNKNYATCVENDGKLVKFVADVKAGMSAKKATPGQSAQIIPLNPATTKQSMFTDPNSATGKANTAAAAAKNTGATATQSKTPEQRK